MAVAINVLIVEREPAIAELLAVNLRRAGHCPLLARSAEKAMRLIREILPDVVLIDWMLPGKSSLSLMRKLRQGNHTRGIPQILLADGSDELQLIAGLDSGADGYIVKPFMPKEVLAHIREVLGRSAHGLADESVHVAGLTISPSTRRVTFGANGSEREVRLRPTEFSLLHYLMAYPERVHSRGMLLAKIWGEHALIEERTVDVHIKRLREALAPVNCAERVQTVRGAGYRFTSTPPRSY